MQQLAWLSEKLIAAYGREFADCIFEGYSINRPVTLRVNTLKSAPAKVREAFSAVNIPLMPVGWYEDAFIAETASEHEIKRLTAYLEGEIYLQSLSSMLPPLFLDAKEGESVLDMTAAPGGKTTQISALTEGKAFITACEKDKLRAERLRFNIARQGAPRVSVLQCDALKLDDFFRFDRILLDAPCSGSGTICFADGAPQKISPLLVKNSASLQEKLLVKALRLLKKGGTLVYSTCSVCPEENGEIVERALKTAGGNLQEIVVPEEIPALPSLSGTLTVCPNVLYEGFFVAKIVR